MKVETIKRIIEEYNFMNENGHFSYFEVDAARRIINIVLYNEFSKNIEDFYDVEQGKFVFNMEDK